MHNWRKKKSVLVRIKAWFTPQKGECGLMQTNPFRHGQAACTHHAQGTDQHVSGTPVVMETTRINLMYHSHRMPLTTHENLWWLLGGLTLFKQNTDINT